MFTKYVTEVGDVASFVIWDYVEPASQGGGQEPRDGQSIAASGVNFE